MNARDALAELKALMKEAERLALALDAERDARPRSPQMTGMPRAGNNTTLDIQMERIESAEKRFEKARERYLERLSEIEDLMDQVTDCRYQRVLYFRHIYLMKWEEVAERMHYAESTVRGFHKKALEDMTRRMKNAE